ncbi:MAG: Ig-like domain-containing protein, partial [Candidatus Binatia bacterium]
LNVIFLEGRISGLSTLSVDLLVDGVKAGSATSEPFLIPLDAVALADGEHVLQAVQTFSDNSTETAQITVIVQPQSPQIKILRPSNGEYLDNLAPIEADIPGGIFAQVQNVEFMVDGDVIGESSKAPFKFLWPNERYPPGKYYIQGRAHLASQANTTDAVQVHLGQGELVVRADPVLSSTGIFFPNRVELIIDASQTMGQPIGAALKIDLAKAALSELFQTLPQDVEVIARVMGGGSASPQQNCGDVQKLKKIGPELEALPAQGVASLALALELFGKDLKKGQGSKVGLLITDGWDECGGDPFAVAKQLTQKGERIQLNIIYFSDVDSAAESLLKRLAETLGGNVYRVQNTDELKEAIRDAVQVSFVLRDQKNAVLLEKPLSENPVTLRSGDYRLEINTVPPLV